LEQNLIRTIQDKDRKCAVALTAVLMCKKLVHDAYFIVFCINENYTGSFNIGFSLLGQWFSGDNIPTCAGFSPPIRLMPHAKIQKHYTNQFAGQSSTAPHPMIPDR
jgi:hypothetical protein